MVPEFIECEAGIEDYLMYLESFRQLKLYLRVADVLSRRSRASEGRLAQVP